LTAPLVVDTPQVFLRSKSLWSHNLKRNTFTIFLTKFLETALIFLSFDRMYSLASPEFWGISTPRRAARDKRETTRDKLETNSRQKKTTRDKLETTRDRLETNSRQKRQGNDRYIGTKWRTFLLNKYFLRKSFGEKNGKRCWRALAAPFPLLQYK
jgi:hypothetical protein